MFPSKSQIGHLICSPAIGAGIRALRPQISRGGILLDLNTNAVPARAVAALRFGMIERAERRVLKSVLTRDLPVIELGAGYGSVTLAIANHVDQSCPMLIIEANPALSTWWQENLQKSGRTNVRFMDVAIICPGDVPVNVGPPHAMVSFVVEPGLLGSRVGNNLSGLPTAKVKALSMREVYVESGFDKFSLVCDIEGAEFSLLKESAREFLSACDSIVMEIHPGPGRKTENLIELFAQHGLRHVKTRHTVLGFTRRARIL
jgi:FkbM family methyltransferase